MARPLLIREASSDESNCLSKLAMRSKAHWGYSNAFMEACIDELTVTCSDIENKESHYVVAVLEDKIVGYYSLECLSGSEIELGALFVDPIHIGTGVGKKLMGSAKCRAKNLGANKIIIQGDPNAAKFYRSAGAVQTGSSESESIPGRYLPTFQITLSNSNVT